MPRRELSQTAGLVLHVINRSARRLRLFEHASDYLAFLNTLAEARELIPVDLMAFCVMPNHFHLVLRPRQNGQLPLFMRWFQMTHSKRWRAFGDTHGEGAVYQGRYRAIPVQQDNHFLALCRYVEANPLRAGLVKRAEDWPWSSLSERCRNCQRVTLEPWPIPQPPNWTSLVNAAARHSDLVHVRNSVQRNVPFGTSSWIDRFPEMLGKQGRVKKKMPGVSLPFG